MLEYSALEEVKRSLKFAKRDKKACEENIEFYNNKALEEIEKLPLLDEKVHELEKYLEFIERGIMEESFDDVEVPFEVDEEIKMDEENQGDEINE
jgi:hypothetical protein